VTRSIDPAQEDVKKLRWDSFDVAFIALHGKFGEDGQVQQILEDALIPHTGSGVAASRLAFSKSASKERFAQHQVPTVPYVLIHESDTAHRILKQAEHLGYPLVVKPDTQGSSLGVTIVDEAHDLPGALARCFQYDAFGLLEQAVRGSEWTVGLLDDRALPPIHIETDRPFFDYAAKYEDDETRYRFESDVPAVQVDRIVQAAKSACAAVGTSGLARVDVILDQNGGPQVLEVNTVPGLTDHSLVPKAAARLGWTMADLCQACLTSALQHAFQRAAIRSGRG
jgi:D-alanine-D-alanine ligase